MKLNLSEKASKHLLALYKASEEQGNLTHFINKLITQLPIKEDTYGHQEESHLRAMQYAI